MENFIREFHSGWRFLVMAMTVFVLVYFAYALYSKATSASGEKRVLQIWGGLIDMQVLLGIILAIALIVNGNFQGEDMGHIVIMFIVAFVGHGLTIYERLNGAPSAQMRRMIGLLLPILAFVLVFIGLQSIGFGLFQMS